MNAWMKSRKPCFVLSVTAVDFAVCASLGVFSVVAIAAEQTTQEAVEKTAERAAEKAAKKAVERVTERAADKAAEKAVEKVAEKAAEKAAAKAEEQAELKAKRPDEWRGATQVHFLVLVIDVDKIDDAEQNFTANVYVRLRWKDERLISSGAVVHQVPLAEVWNPQVLLVNRVGLVSRSLPETVQVLPDGTVFYRQRYTGKMSQPLRLSEFPLDKHAFTIQFCTAGYSADEVEFVPDTASYDPTVVGGTIASKLSLPDWCVVDYEALPLPYAPTADIHVPGFAFRFEAERYFAYYLWQVVLPLAVVVVMSWAAFWIDTRHVGVRIAVATSSILTLIAHRFVLANLLPRLPYMTRMDYFTVGSTLLVLLALVAVIGTSALDARSLTSRARKVDLLARFVFPVTFLALFGWFLFG